MARRNPNRGSIGPSRSSNLGKEADAAKNRKLDEFLKALRIEDEKRGKIVAFVEEITFKRLKELSTGITEEKENEKKKLRLRMPWDKN